MIPFFRKIRKKMADENKPIKYLRYAIGEIVLVVIGILIALQINNWNESQETNRLKSVYLNRLINDIKKDTANINFVRSEIELNQKVIKQLIAKVNSGSSIKALDSLLTNYFQRGWIISEWVPTNNTYTDLSQTGNMNILKNTDLIDEIIQYYSYTSQVENSNGVNKNWITPIDQEVAKITPAFEFDPTTKELFSHKNKLKAMKNIQINHQLIERNAAGHYWINQSLSENLLAIKGLCLQLLKDLQEEYDKTVKNQ